MLRVAAALAFVGSFAQPVAAHAQGATARSTGGLIEGVVTDTGLVALSDVAVAITGASMVVTTGPNGRFRINVAGAGRYFLIARRMGFQGISTEVLVTGGDTLRLALSLDRVVTELKTVTVEATHVSPRMAEFEERRKLGEGQFMTQAEIEKRASIFATELLRSFKSIKFAPTAGLGSPGWYPVSIRAAAGPVKRTGLSGRGGAGVCYMQVVIDGITQDTPYNLDLLPPPKELAAIEVYSGPATIPLQFKGYDRSCGVILVWTRDGG